MGKGASRTRTNTKLDRIQSAIGAYVSGNALLGGAAEIAKTSYCDFREMIRLRGLLSARSVGLTRK